MTPAFSNVVLLAYQRDDPGGSDRSTDRDGPGLGEDATDLIDLRYNKSPSPLMGFGMERATLCVLNDAAVAEDILSGQCEIPMRRELSVDEEERHTGLSRRTH